MHLAAPQPDVLPQGDAQLSYCSAVRRRALSSEAAQRPSARSWLSSTLTSYLSARKPGRYAVEKGFRSV